MEVYSPTQRYSISAPTCITAGTFDGLHLGHIAIVKATVAEARARKFRSVLVTYFPHPRSVVGGARGEVAMLTTMAERQQLLAELGVDDLVILPFNEELANLSAEEFVSQILVEKLSMQFMVVGYDHRFGKNRAGGLDLLRSLGVQRSFGVHEVSAAMVGGTEVSSTKVRMALAEGRVADAAAMMGRCYTVSGKVVSGQGLGKSLGFATANIQLNDAAKAMPALGVYVVRVRLHGAEYGGMANYGIRPTFQGTQPVLEVHLFNFSEAAYGAEAEVQFVERLRREEKFESKDLLAQQLQADAAHARQLLNA